MIIYIPLMKNKGREVQFSTVLSFLYIWVQSLEGAAGMFKHTQLKCTPTRFFLATASLTHTTTWYNKHNSSPVPWCIVPRGGCLRCKNLILTRIRYPFTIWVAMWYLSFTFFHLPYYIYYYIYILHYFIYWLLVLSMSQTFFHHNVTNEILALDPNHATTSL